ncbi:MAG TPA: hypothetical protein VM900_13915 [Sphingomonas sp.]|jgi:Na+-driven multidrug efflux pump|nr:hypothetical protein [Sphingomonas sp.]
MRVFGEIVYLVAGLVIAALLVWAASWAYPLGREVFWWCGAAAMATNVVFGVGRLRRARDRDQVRL